MAHGAQLLIDQLEKVRQTGPNRWIACCPAHDDLSPSLSIKELDNGRVLIHCHAGCGALDVLYAVGLQWQHLFPETDQNYPPLYQNKRRPLADKTVDEWVLEIARDRRRRGKSLNEADKQRELIAFQRIKAAK